MKQQTKNIPNQNVSYNELNELRMAQKYKFKTNNYHP